MSKKTFMNALMASAACAAMFAAGSAYSMGGCGGASGAAPASQIAQGTFSAQADSTCINVVDTLNNNQPLIVNQPDRRAGKSQNKHCIRFPSGKVVSENSDISSPLAAFKK